MRIGEVLVALRTNIDNNSNGNKYGNNGKYTTNSIMASSTIGTIAMFRNRTNRNISRSSKRDRAANHGNHSTDSWTSMCVAIGRR